MRTNRFGECRTYEVTGRQQHGLLQDGLTKALWPIADGVLARSSPRVSARAKLTMKPCLQSVKQIISTSAASFTWGASAPNTAHDFFRNAFSATRAKPR